MENLWCRFMHDEPMWPIHGQYECRTCGQHHRVRWDPSLQAEPSDQPVGEYELLNTEGA